MAQPRIVRLAESWRPDPGDPFGEDQYRLVRHLIENAVDGSKPKLIAKLLKEVGFTRAYKREEFQHNLLGPLRRDPKLFIGWSSAGVYLVAGPEDADAALGAYTSRIRAELRHARSLRALAKRAKLFDNYVSPGPKKKNQPRAVIYMDESGSPDVTNLSPAVFVVAAVVVESRQALADFDQRFKNAFAVIKRPEEHELKSSGLSVAKHARVLRELSLLDYQWAAACFDKAKLDSVGFQDPKTFYRYAFNFLIADLLTVAWQAELVIDENSTPEFQAQLEAHLRRQNSGLPIERIQKISFAQSSKERLVQLADLVAGAVRLSAEGQNVPLREIEPQMINLQVWPQD